MLVVESGNEACNDETNKAQVRNLPAILCLLDLQKNSANVLSRA